MVQRLLHGTLHATIYEVDRLRTGCGFGLCFKGSPGKTFLGQVKRLVCCYHEVAGSRLYATVDLDKARVGRTRMIGNQSSNPRWNQSFHIFCAHTISNIIFTIKDDNPIGATLIGRAYLPVEDILSGFIVDRWVPILDQAYNPIPGGSKIRVKLQFSGATRDNNWSQGIKSPQFEGVPYTFFLQRRGCKVTLYQDADVDDDFYPRIVVSGGHYYEPKKCWADVFDAIINAKHLIYITGWSIYPEIALIRDAGKPGANMKLGELLKQKAEEGVTVLMLVWHDRTSVKDLNEDGIMATHDEETEAYFRNSKVHCFLCPRDPDNGRSIVQGFEVSTMFTHHQKTIVADCIDQNESQKRRLVSFVGGIDLCDGRYDTQDHPLFKTLGTTHRDDFHQPNFEGASIKKGGPREPWHDIHCRLEGPIAWDVLYNFEQRWRKQAMTFAGNDFLVPMNKLEQIIVKPSPATLLDDPETWNVQLFRSIDGGAASGFPKSPEKADEVGLVSGKDNIIDRSIQDAYIHAIRRAKNFIYIENQYFLGSSFGWKSNDIKDEDVGALHLIPKELSLKIVSKIEAGERFVVYVVLPMWPEGKPESASVQAILDWQRRTMEMMYSDIAKAIQAKGTHAYPWEYLTFYCLGNRETYKRGEYEPMQKPEVGTNYMRAQEARRFMIYVHSKMMIVDDEYIIIGSANINQRSMDGGRDTEIAMGGYQPHHLAAQSGAARGQIYGFRMALWYEHVRLLHPSFHHPESLECVQIVNQIAERNWEIYSAHENADKDLPIHLLRYPIKITNTGLVTTLDGFQFFPDTKAPILGTKSDYLPSILTT